MGVGDVRRKSAAVLLTTNPDIRNCLIVLKRVAELAGHTYTDHSL